MVVVKIRLNESCSLVTSLRRVNHSNQKDLSNWVPLTLFFISRKLRSSEIIKKLTIKADESMTVILEDLGFPNKRES